MSEDKSKLQLIGEIAQANNKNLELIEEINEKEDEIERLNNIINELENYIVENSFGSPANNCCVIETYKIVDKLRELKGSDKVE